MLVELRIKNFAIIEELSLELSSGLNVISGETGSGKSLVLDAFQLILGARPNTSYFRKGANAWEIEALLSLGDTPSEVKALLPEQIRNEEEVLLSRTMNQNGRGKVYMNGKLATVQMLQEISTRMLALCTQGQQMLLHDPDYILKLIDEYVGAKEMVVKYREQFRELKRLESEMSKLLAEKEQRVLKQAEIEFLVQELSELEPVVGLREQLEGRLSELQGYQDAASAVQASLGILLDHAGVFSLLERCRKELSGIPEDRRAKLEEKLDVAEGELGEFETLLGGFESDSDEVENELENISRRLSDLARLERKYKTDDEGLALLFEKACSERDEAHDVEREKLLSAALQEKRSKVEALALAMRDKRVSGSKDFEKNVRAELSDLGMKAVRLEVAFDEHELRESGSETVRLMFAPNPGEEPKLLQEIASGGELSRVMLVIKKLFRDRSGVNILIFDEVDTGVSGAVAQAVGEKMSEISRFSQVICITHLPQVACYADNHFSISKEAGQRTRSVVRQLEPPERVEEIAKMLSGYKITQAARESARELLSSKIVAIESC